MSECKGADCDHSSHDAPKIEDKILSDEIEKKLEDGNSAPIPPAPEAPVIAHPKIQAPAHAVFAKGEIITVKGFHFRFVGYNKGDWNVVFEVAGRTAKSQKKRGR